MIVRDFLNSIESSTKMMTLLLLLTTKPCHSAAAPLQLVALEPTGSDYRVPQPSCCH